MKATPEQWNEAGSFASDTRACLLELRARVEALEAAQPKQITQEELAKLLAQPAPVVPLATASAGSLVERVADAIVTKATSAGIVDDRPARAAIREVARWMDEHHSPVTAHWLELEVSRG